MQGLTGTSEAQAHSSALEGLERGGLSARAAKTATEPQAAWFTLRRSVSMRGRPFLLLATIAVTACSSDSTNSALGSSSVSRSKESQCRELVGAVNRGSENLARNAPMNDAGTSDYGSVASTMEQTAKEASELRLELAELQGFASRYQKMAKEIANQAREISLALAAKDLEKAGKGEAALTQAKKEEDALAEAIGKFCGAP